MISSRIADSGWAAMVPYGLEDRFMALSYHLYIISTQWQNVTESYKFGTAIVMIGLVIVVNSFSIGFRIYLRSRKKW